MKHKVLVDLKVVCDPPNLWLWDKSIEARAKDLDSWAREFNEFIRDHRSKDDIHLSVEREYEEQCSHCHRQWEIDDEGPTCCNAAQEEWNNEKVKQ